MSNEKFFVVVLVELSELPAYVSRDTGFPMALEEPYISGSNLLLAVTGCLCSSSLQLSL